MNKRIAVISYHTCPLADEKAMVVGGLNTYVIQLSKELARKGLHIDIYTRLVEENTQRIVRVTPNLRVIHLPAGEHKPLPKKQIARHLQEFLENFYQFIRAEGIHYDTLSCHYYLSGLIGLEIKNHLHVPLIVTFHTLALMKNLVARTGEETEDLDRIKAEILLVKEADQIIATSPSDAEYLSTLYNCPGEKLCVLTPGVSPEVFHPMDKIAARNYIGAEKEHKVVLFVGRIEPLKGLDVLLYSLKILLEKNPQLKVSLWIVGADNLQQNEMLSQEQKKLEEIKKLLHISTVVHFVARKATEELPYYYNAADVVVLPSQYESFGIVALEAMACGIPVIITDVTGIAGIFDRNRESVITSANNPLLLSDKIKQLLTNEREYQKVSQEGYNKVRDLSWKNVAEKFIKLCEAKS